MARVRFNSFQHNLLFFYLFFHSLCALCLETGQRCPVRIGQHPYVQNPTSAPLQRQSVRKKASSSFCWSTFLRMKEQFQIHELLEVSKDKAKLLQTELFFMGCTTRARSINLSVQRHYSQKDKCKIN